MNKAIFRTMNEKGFGLLEMVIGLAISGILATVVAATIPMMMKVAPQQANKLGVEADLSFARYWLTRDSNAAETFVPLYAPQYGRLNWRDYSGQSLVSYNVTYSYDATTASLVREERQNGVLQTSLPVARKILNPSDAQFTWSPGTGKLTIALMATIEDAPGVGSYSRNATIETTIRPRLETTVSPPGEVPILPPPPGSVTYYIAVPPTIITGSYVSGTVASLHDMDSSYYVVNSATVSGSKVVSWSALSEVMTAPTTISQIEVRFTSQVNRQNITMEFYIKNSAAGFPATGASGFTFTQADTLTTHSFLLDATALAYVNSLPERRVTLKVTATGSATFSLSTDQVVFIASP